MAATATRLALAILVAIALVGCGPENLRDDPTPTPTGPTRTASPSATPNVSATPTPSPVATATIVHTGFVRVLGTARTLFTGSVTDGTGSRSVDGEIPEDFVLATPQTFISATFTKAEAGFQTLTAQIIIDGRVAAEQTTVTNFGTVTVNAPIR